MALIARWLGRHITIDTAISSLFVRLVERELGRSYNYRR